MSFSEDVRSTNALAGFKTIKNSGPSLLLRLAVLHNPDRDVAAARTFKRALLIQSARFNSRKPHVSAALGASRVEDTLGSDFGSTRRPIKHGATLAGIT
jgi:hypothetical protein